MDYEANRKLSPQNGGSSSKLSVYINKLKNWFLALSPSSALKLPPSPIVHYGLLRQLQISGGAFAKIPILQLVCVYIKIKGKWFYLYRAVDSDGNTLDWMLSETREKKAAVRFLKELVSLSHSINPRVINTDKNTAYQSGFEDCNEEKIFCKETEIRQVKYLNNIIEQDHRFVKRRVKNSLWLQSFRTAKSTIAGYETMHMIRKEQVEYLCKNDPINQVKFIDNLFGIAA